jgi:hypothetical protein
MGEVKGSYVRAPGRGDDGDMATTHLCLAHECSERVSFRLLMCKPHWLSLPKSIRDAVWREYQEGSSFRLLAVQQLAVAHSALLPNDEEAALVAAEYLAQAETYATSAIKKGLGDPLEGLRPDGGDFR